MKSILVYYLCTLGTFCINHVCDAFLLNICNWLRFNDRPFNAILCKNCNCNLKCHNSIKLFLIKTKKYHRCKLFKNYNEIDNEDLIRILNGSYAF